MQMTNPNIWSRQPPGEFVYPIGHEWSVSIADSSWGLCSLQAGKKQIMNWVNELIGAKIAITANIVWDWMTSGYLWVGCANAHGCMDNQLIAVHPCPLSHACALLGVDHSQCGLLLVRQWFVVSGACTLCPVVSDRCSGHYAGKA